MKSFLRNLKISTKISILVGLALLLMGSVTVFGLSHINAMGKEVEVIIRGNIPLMQTSGRITFHELEQSIHLERAIQFGRNIAQSNAAKDNFEKERNNFLSHGRTIAQEIEKNRTLIERIYRDCHHHRIQDLVSRVDYELRNIHEKQTDLQLLAERTFNLLSQGKIEAAELNIQNIARKTETEEDSHIQQSNHLEKLSLAIEDFIGYSITQAQIHKDRAMVGMFWFSVTILLFSLGLGVFISGSISKPLRRAVNIADRIAAGERDVEIEAVFKNETGRLLEAMKKMASSIHRTEESLKHQTDNLGERLKELNCLYKISELAKQTSFSLDDIFRKTVDLIPPAWHYPEITCAGIIIDGHRFTTDNFEETEWKQVTDIIASGGKIGSLEVYYLQPRPVIDEGPFLKEERSLIDALGKQLGSIIKYKQAEEKLEVSNINLESLNEKLTHSNQQLQEFTYIASHDLREPARKISSFGQLLTKSLAGKLNDDEQENLDFMIDGADRMQQMIESLLVYSRVSTKKTEFEDVDLNEVIEKLKTLELAAMLQETDGKISVPQPLPAVKGDPSQICRLLQNVISNALKFHKPGISPEVIVRANIRVDGMVCVEIEDNGIGIKREQHENVFTMFRRLHSRKDYDGTGIGLTVCKRIVERHKGEIGIRSVYGSGLTFWFTLPALQSSQSKQLQPVSVSTVLET